MRNKFYIRVAIVIQLLFSLSIKAGVTTRSSRLMGSQIALNASFETHDELYSYMIVTAPSLWNFSDKRIDNRINLRFTAADKKFYNQNWSVTVDFKVDLYNNVGAYISTQFNSLTVNYDPSTGSAYNDIATYSTTGGYSARVTVLNITTSSNLGGVVPTDVMLENEIETERYYMLDVSIDPGLKATYNATDNTILFTWDYVEGAEEFDLEWLYVYSNVYALGPMAYSFDNATRVSTPQNYYSINAAFDKGNLICRVRTVGRHGPANNFDYRKEGFWFQSPNVITLSDFQSDKKNWTYSSVYAEEGKRKEVATFFDGSSRNRQSVTLNNSDNISLVQESFYDYEGRSAVKTLPAPQINTGGYDHQLKYYSLFSVNQNSQLYNKLDYDNSVNSCAGVGKMKNTTGSSKYFSGNNTVAVLNEFNSFLPDAQEYPFVHTRYGLENVVTSISGVGPVLKTGTGHETKMYDVGAGQEKLDRLFGNEAGYASHYREKVVIDPNGQVSVSYVNMGGKVVATALRGTVATSPKTLIPLIADVPTDPIDQNEPYMTAELTKEDFSSLNLHNSATNCNEITKNFMVTNATGTAYTFNYNISPQTFHELCLNSTYPCKYNLLITIQDECKNVIPDNNSVLNNNIVVTSSFTGVSFTVNFPHNGMYTIVKTLCLDQTQETADFNQYLTDLSNPAIPNKCINFSGIDADHENQVDNEECLSCDDYAKKLADQDAGTDHSTQAWTTAYQNYLRQNCFEPPKKDCGTLEANILKDVSPGGQYFEYIEPSSGLHWVDFLFFTYHATSQPMDSWFNSLLTVAPAPPCTTSIPPVGSLYTYLAANWDPCFATKLESFHPELCRLERCKKLSCSTSFDYYLENLDYNMAITTDVNAHACTNPSGCAILDLTSSPTGISLLGNDPFFTTVSSSNQFSTCYNSSNPGALGAAFLSAAATQINNCSFCAAMYSSAVLTNPPNNCSPTAILSTSASHSMWEYAQFIPTIAGSCNGSTFTPDLSQQWRNFVALYESFKAEQVAKIPCLPLADHSNPPDNVSDPFWTGGAPYFVASNTIYINGMTILDPEPVNYVSTTGGNINTNGYGANPNPNVANVPQASPNCYTNSFVKFSYSQLHSFLLSCSQVAYSDNITISVSNVPNQSTNPVYLTSGVAGWNPPHSAAVNIADPSLNSHSGCPGSPDCLGTHPLNSNCNPNYYSTGSLSNCDQYILLNTIAQNINSNTSTTGFFAVVSPVPPSANPPCSLTSAPEIFIYPDPSVLPYLTPAYQSTTPMTLTFIEAINNNDPNGGGNLIFNSTVRTCPDSACLCSDFSSLKGQFLAIPANSTIASSDPNIIQTADISAFVAYATPLLNNLYNPTPPFTTAQVTYWFTNCNLYGDVYPVASDGSVQTPSTSSGLLLHDVTCEEGCEGQQEAEDEAGFEADQEIQSLIDQNMQNFINDYTSTCFSNLNEKFKVEYTESEYHYTLYYYDQAGNLVRTVPPKGVQRIDATTLYGSSGLTNVVNDARIANTGFIYTGHSRYPQTTTIYGLNPNLLVTEYTYNTIDEISSQHTPEGYSLNRGYPFDQGNYTQFWYDKLGRIRFSQNSKQYASAIIVPGSVYYGNYSYTIYDKLNRIIEVGENNQTGTACLTNTIIITSGTGNPSTGRLFSPGNVPQGSTLACPPNTSPDPVPFFWMVDDETFPTQPGMQVTKTYYDNVISGNNAPTVFPGGSQQNLRKRVVTSSFEEVEDNNDNTYDHATHYSYDVHGNVQSLVQENTMLNRIHQQYKILNYKYDLISGKLNEVSYQDDQMDQFHHHYYYDADNRLTNAFSSNDRIHWDQDARYFYYPHGTMARVELADEKVQGMDYVYTAQGWIKGVNNNTLNSRNDVGLDGVTGTHLFLKQYSPVIADLDQNVGRDAMGYVLDYFQGDYASTTNSSNSSFNLTRDFNGAIQTAGNFYSSAPDLFNGNIKLMSYGIAFPGSLTTSQNMARVFNYDQLNRIISSTSYKANTGVYGSITAYAAGTESATDYYEDFRYDPNGNILEVNRRAYNNGGNNLDHLVYNYAAPYANNMLDNVDDQLDNSNFTTDFKTGQTATNYQYDQIGNLQSDVQEQIEAIEWSVYGKIKTLTRLPNSTKPDLEFRYDAHGNRVCKIEKPRPTGNPSNQGAWIYTFYVRDAQGNVMTMMNRSYNSSTPNHYTELISVNEHDVYGSSRIAVRNESIGLPSASFQDSQFDADGLFSNISNYVVSPPAPMPLLSLRMLGSKNFELSNHLGNVLAVVDDKKLQEDGSGIDQGTIGIADYYTGDIQSTTDYYAFGAPMPGRQYTSTNYRYGFNGKENDPEVVSTGNGSQDYGMRIYNPALGRFFSVDPLTRKFPYYTPYQFAGNKPILAVDLDGAEEQPKTGPGTEAIQITTEGCPENSDNINNDLHIDKVGFLKQAAWSWDDLIGFTTQYDKFEKLHANDPSNKAYDCFTSFEGSLNHLYKIKLGDLGSQIIGSTRGRGANESLNNLNLIGTTLVLKANEPTYSEDGNFKGAFTENPADMLKSFVKDNAGVYVFATGIGMGWHTAVTVVDARDVNNMAIYTADEVDGFENRTTPAPKLNGFEQFLNGYIFTKEYGAAPVYYREGQPFGNKLDTYFYLLLKKLFDDETDVYFIIK